MSRPVQSNDRRAMILLCAGLGPVVRGSAAPLSPSAWQRIGSRLRLAGLSGPGDLLEGEPGSWRAAGLTDDEVSRLRGLLGRVSGLDAELERLSGLGIRVLTRPEPDYPARLRERLRGLAPPVLFAVGPLTLLQQPSLAIAGSREVDAEGVAFTESAAGRCARDGLAVITGGAMGVDQIAMQGALEAGGAAVGVLAGDLERRLREREVRRWLAEEQLLLLSPYHPRAGFTVVNAMSRNKIVYALADYGLVVSSAAGHGGTWAGAREALRHGWAPLFVRDGPGVPDGNRELLRPAALPFPPLESLDGISLRAWLEQQIASSPESAPAPKETGDLFLLVWPHLAEYLRAERTSTEVAERFALRPEQVLGWLRRAETEGRVARLKRKPQLWVAVLEPPLQDRLFEGAVAYSPAPSVHQLDRPEVDLWGWPRQ